MKSLVEDDENNVILNIAEEVAWNVEKTTVIFRKIDAVEKEKIEVAMYLMRDIIKFIQ